MIKYGYYALAILYSIFLIITLFLYVTKPAPSGDASIGWARGIFFSVFLFGVLIIGLLFWKRPVIGFFIFCIPLVFLALPYIRDRLTDLYAISPTLEKVPPLTITINNTTNAKVHVQLNCWFSTSEKGTSSLYKTLDYTMEPLKTNDYKFTSYETNLLAKKSSYVSVMIYEQVVNRSSDGVLYTKEIQPCMQFYDEKTEAFRNGKYTIVIDSSKNSPQFKSEVGLLKEQNMYGTGVF